MASAGVFSSCTAQFSKVGATVSKKRLDSWKAIAVFLDRSLRTVQRWHVCNGLPVHHFGGQKGSVFAYEEEIEHWLAHLAEESGAAQQQAVANFEVGRRRSEELIATADGMWQTRSESNIQAIAELYRRAITDDSPNPAAYAGLANTMIFCALNDIMDGALAYPCAADALRRAQHGVSVQSDTRCAAAWLDLLYNRDWQSARRGFDEVLSVRPSSFALAGMAAMDVAQGNVEKAYSRAWEAWRLNPLVSSLGAFVSWIVYLNGHFQQSLDLVAQIRSGGGDGGFLSVVEALAFIQSGSVSAKLDCIEKASSKYPLNHTLQGILGYAYWASDQPAKARKVHKQLADSTAMSGHSNGYGLAIVSLGLGNCQEAIGWLEAAYAEGTLRSLGFRTDPMLKALSGDPRFQRLVDKIGFGPHLQMDTGFLGLSNLPNLGSILVGECP